MVDDAARGLRGNQFPGGEHTKESAVELTLAPIVLALFVALWGKRWQ